MKNFSPLKDCPVCASHDGRCRETEDNLILCMGLVDAVIGVPGYRYVKPNKNGLWGIWALDSEDHETSEEWRSRLDQRARENAAKERRRQEICLSDVERDRHYRRLLASLDLHPLDRQDLHRRGFTDQQIAAVGFKSVSQWQRLDRHYPQNLPGILKGGRSLNTFAPGYLCPVRNQDGLIVALQVRAREGDTRYYWLTSHTQTNPDGATPHTQRGELPLTYVQGKGDRPWLAFCEGTGAKPHLASIRLGCDVVGAAGGQFGSSPEQVKAALESNKTPVLLPDGGAIANPNVMRQYRALAQLVPGLQVLWWEQRTKADGDIDEINAATLDNAALISFAEFEAMATATGTGDDRALEHYKAQTEAIIGHLSRLDIEPTLQLSGSYIPRNTHHWLPADSKILAIDAPMGVGKTSTYLKELVAQHREQFPHSIQYLLTPTNALGQQSAQKLDLPHHTKLTSYGIPQLATLCPPSGWRFPVARLPGDRPLIMIDEPSALLEQIADGKTCGDKHALILQWMRQLFRWVRKQQGWIVLSEDGLSNCEIDLIKEASGMEAVDLITFVSDRHRQSERDYTVFERRSMLDCALKNRLSGGENLVLASDSKKWLENARDKAIAMGIPEDDVWILTGDNSSDEWAIAFTEDPDRWVAETKPRILGFSPACVSGLSIDDPHGHFDALGFCLTHLSPGQAKQMPERLRTDVPRFGYIKEHGAVLDATFSSARPEVIIRDFYRNKAGIERLTQFAEYALEKAPTDVEGNPIDLVGAIAKIKASQTDPDSDFGFWLRWWANYQAKANYTRANLRESLIHLWESRGHRIHLIQGNSSAENQESTVLRETRERGEATAMANRSTEDLSLSDAWEILEGSQAATSEDRKRAQKRILEDKLPTCNLSDPDFIYKAIIKDDGRFLRATELLWLAKNPKAAQWLDRWCWASEANTAVRRGTFVSYSRLSFHSGKAKLLNECPLAPFIDGTVEQWDNKTPEAIAVHQWAVLHRHEFRRHFRLRIADDHPPVKTVNKLLRKLSLNVAECGWKGSREDRQRQYCCTNLLDADRDTILESLEVKFNQRLKAKEGNLSELPVQTVIATCMDTNSLTSCDHELPPLLAQLPWHYQGTLAEMWAAATTSQEKADLKGEIAAILREVGAIAS